MTLKELDLFYKIYQNPNLTQVAKEQNISQSAVSMAIKSLEKKLNEPLFNRIGKKLIPNQRGRKFYKLSFIHYEKLLDAKEVFLSSTISGDLKVYASKSISNYIMPKIYFDFLSLHVNVTLHSNTKNSSQIIRDVQDGYIDLGLIESEFNAHDIVKECFKKDELVLVTSDEKYKKQTYIDSIDKKWVLRENGSGTKDEFLKRLEDKAKYVKEFLVLRDFSEIKQVLLSHKNTISVMSKLAVKEEILHKKLFEIKLKNIDLCRNFYIIYHKNHHKNRLFCEFIEFVKKHSSL